MSANRRIGVIPGILQTQIDYAHMLLTRDAHEDRRQAAELAGQALNVARERGMDGIARAAAALLEEAQGAARRRRRSPVGDASE